MRPVRSCGAVKDRKFTVRENNRKGRTTSVTGIATIAKSHFQGPPGRTEARFL